MQSRISNSVSNELRVGYTRVRDWREAAAPDGAPTVSISVSNPTDDSNRKTTVYLGNEYCSYANQLDQDIFTITDNLTWYKGNHTITLGTHNEFYKMYNVYAQNATGAWSFNSLEDFMNNQASQFRYTYYENDDLDEKGNWGAKFGAAQFGLYLQDEWRANDKFTLTYGLRMDVPVMFKDPSVNEAFNNSDVAKKYGVLRVISPLETCCSHPVSDSAGMWMRRRTSFCAAVWVSSRDVYPSYGCRTSILIPV